MPDARVSKRRKTLLACDVCRRQKIKCDGIHPVCGNCSKKGWSRDQCIWKHVDGRFENVPEPASFVRQLEQRVRELERQIRSPSSQTPAAQSTAESIARAGARRVNAAGISAMEGAVTGKPQSEGFIGLASAASFMDLIRRAAEPGVTVPGLTRNAMPFQDMGSTPTMRQPSFSYDLPPRHDMDKLVQAYWVYIYPLYPFLYKPRFDDMVVSLRRGESNPDARSPLTGSAEANSVCLVNLVLALACQYYETPSPEDAPSERSEPGATFFNRARSVFQYDVADGTNQSLQVVQIMLLMAQYLNSVGSPQKSWELIGLAIRICQRLGLHRGAATDQTAIPDPVEREMVKRIWHGCVLLERWDQSFACAAIEANS